MRISDIPEYKDRSELLTIAQDITIYDAAKMMKDHNYGSAIIVDNKAKLLGILTERDILNRVAARGLDVKKTKVKEVMTSKLRTAKFSDTISDSIRRMSQGRFRHLPIVDDEDQVVGLVSQGDLVAYSWPQIFTMVTHKAKSSFLTYTEIWLMILVILAYLTIVLFVT